MLSPATARQASPTRLAAFRKAIDKLVPGVPKGTIAALFSSLDDDESDSLEYSELHSKLRATAEEARPGAQKALKTTNKVRPIAVRVPIVRVGDSLLLRGGSRRAASHR